MDPGPDPIPDPEKNRIHPPEKTGGSEYPIHGLNRILGPFKSSLDTSTKQSKQPTCLFVLNIDVVLDYGPVHGILVGEAQETEAASFLFLLNRIPSNRTIVNHNDKR